ncbi:peptidoglycan-binding protein, partial [Patescibacteria group bacterium]|nr:peptidoglycan-binding protein [Patescibacteria group bacterium]
MSKNFIRKTKVGKITSAFVGITTAVWLSGAAAIMPIAAQADTMSDLQAQISALLAQITTLQSQLSALQGGTGTACGYTFGVDLKQGSTGADAKNLQTVLNSDAATQVAASGVGSSGNETTYFGPLTKAAVVKFQDKYASEVLTPIGLTAGTGYVGSMTRAKLNALFGTCVTPPPPGETPPPSVGTGISVSSAIQPAASIAPNSAARLPFTKVTLTAGTDGDVVVNGIQVERTGLAVDANFAGIVLLDEDGLQLGIAKTLNSLHQATIGEAFTVKAGQSRTMTIAGNMASSNTARAGQIAFISVTGLSTSATVTGTLPITGAGHVINATLTIGTATPSRGPLDPNATISKEIGTTGYTFSSVKVTAGSTEKVIMNSIRWNQSGSAGSSDLANVKVYVDGTAYDTTISSDGKYYTASFGSGIVIDKGLSKEVSIKADIISGTTRNIAFDLYKNTDLNVTGETYGYGITPASTGTGFAATTPWYDASVVTISAGTVSSISQSNTVPAQNIAVLAANQPLGGFEVKIRGEAITVQQMIFNIQATGDEAENITSIRLVDQNGSVVAGPVDGASTATDSAYGTVTFTDAVTFPIGDTILKLQGQLGSTFVANDTVQASTTPSTQWTTVTGVSTGDTVSLASFSSAVQSNLMTVKAGAMAMNVSSQPTARNVIAGAKGFEFARYILDASQSGEDVRLSNFKALLALTTVTASQLSNCNLYDGTTNVTDGTNVTLAAGDNTFTFNGGGLTVPKGTQKSISMKCDLSAGATSGTVKWGLTDNSSTYTSATSVGSGQTVVETMTAAAGQTMTAATSGSYTVTEDSALLYSVAQAGTTGVTLARIRFTAGATEAVDLKQIALQLGNTASNSPADLVGERVTLLNGTTLAQIGTAQFGGANPDNATSTILTPAPRIAAGESVVIIIKGDLSAQNVNEGTPGAFLAITYDGDNNGINGNYATGVDSQVSISGGTASDITTNGLRIFRTVPMFAVTSTGGTLAPGADLYKFTVTNGNNRDVVLQKFSFSVATTGGAVTGFTLYGDGVTANGSVVEAPLGVLEVAIDATSQAKIVPANSSKTYVLKASAVVDTAAVAETINIALLADTSYPAIADLMGTVTSVEAGSGNTDNIIWSPFSTTTPVATSATESNLDWTNGYGLPGF